MTTPQEALTEQLLRQHLPELPAARLPAVAASAADLREAAAALAARLPMAADPSVFAALLAHPLPPAPPKEPR